MGRPKKGVAALRPSTPEEKTYNSDKYRKNKLKAMQIVMAGGLAKLTGSEVPKCVHCGCNVVDFLEFSHLHTTHMERGGDHNRNLALRIVEGRVDLSDIEIACRICNAKLYLEKKFGPTGHTITWNTPLWTLI